MKRERRHMLMAGLGLLAAAIGGLWLALPRHGQVQAFVGNDLIEAVIAFLITACGAVGLIVFLGGLARL
jgi:hypothetical protein